MNRTPMEFWCWSCFALGRGLVNRSATFRSVCTLQISMSSSWTFSRLELKRRLMCLVFLWNLGSLARVIAPMLSPKRVIGPDTLGIIPRSVMNSFIQTASCAASEAAMYSASHVDPATTLCLQLHQLTAPPFNKNMYPFYNLKSSGSVSKLTSTQIWMTRSHKPDTCIFWMEGQ